MHIIPAIDIIDGKCVRLIRGDYSTQTIYSEDPVEVARQFEDHGLSRLHMVDLDGARRKKVINLPVLEKVVNSTTLKVDFGGGIHSNDDIKRVFEAGASQITAGSIAVTNEEMLQQWIDQYGTEKIILGADVKNGKIAVSGWQEQSSFSWEEFLADRIGTGLTNVISTDISRDGMLAGPSFELYGLMLDRFPNLNLIASGGISSLADLRKLEQMNLYGAIIGKAIYEGRITLKELSSLLKE